MALPTYSAEEQVGVLDRVLLELGVILEADEPIDIITFATSEKYLGGTLYPRQALILKLYYGLDLVITSCWCIRNSEAPKPDCNLCHGTGLYDEFEDTKFLLGATHKYAKLYFPGLCEHHILGTCSKDSCQIDKKDYRVLSDEEIRERLKALSPYLLLVIAGRRSGKSFIGSYINAYTLYRMLRTGNPQVAFGNLAPGSEIGTANVAKNEEQAKILFNYLVNRVRQSSWFMKFRPKILESSISFLAQGVVASSLHSASASVRGKTLLSIFLDEFCHFNRTTGTSSDDAMKKALEPAVALAGKEARVVVISSPINKAGTAWEWFDAAERRVSNYLNIMAFQLASWEMNPNLDEEENAVISGAYASDRVYAEQEYGGQWSETVGTYIPADAVDACGKESRSQQIAGKSGVKYSLHVDLSKNRDRTTFTICHYDFEISKLVTDRVEIYDPKNRNNELMTEDGKEIDHEKVLERILRLYFTYKFKFNSITFDQFNSAWLIQALRKKLGDFNGDWIEERAINDTINQAMYSNLYSLITQGSIEYPREKTLMAELIALVKVNKTSGKGYRVEAPPGMTDDAADGLAACALRCLELALGINSSIVVAKKTSKEQIAELLESPYSDERIYHLRSCREKVCGYGCPVERRKKEDIYGVSHHPKCTTAYCVWNCPLARAIEQQR